MSLEKVSQISVTDLTICFLLAEPQPLSDLCRRTIRKSMGKEHISKANVDKLPIPVPIKRYLLYQQGW